MLLKYLVDLIGIEPMTSSMPWKRAPSCATGPLSLFWGRGGVYVKRQIDMRPTQSTSDAEIVQFAEHFRGVPVSKYPE